MPTVAKTVIYIHDTQVELDICFFTLMSSLFVLQVWQGQLSPTC